MVVSHHRDSERANIHTSLVRKPGWTHVKWIYLFSKWLGLLNQMSDLLHPETLLCMLIPLFSGIQIWIYFLAAYSPVPVSTCEVFFMFQGTTFQFLQLCLDAILILRSKSTSI
jgi:hypothetical protein